MDKLRLRFEKTGRAIYISHLDLMHTIQRSFSRAGYELKYSEGFNPHPAISIALPMSVGASSVCEVLDFKLKDDPVLSELPDRLSAAMPEGLRVIEAYEPQRKPAEIKWLQVEGTFDYDNRDSAQMSEKLREFYRQENIIIRKRTKHGEGDADIRPQIKSISFKTEAGAVKVSAVISAQEPTLNPELLADALRQKAPEIAPDFSKFTRIEIFDAQMSAFR